MASENETETTPEQQEPGRIDPNLAKLLLNMWKGLVAHHVDSLTGCGRHMALAVVSETVQRWEQEEIASFERVYDLVQDCVARAEREMGREPTP